MQREYIIGWIDSVAGRIPRVSSTFSTKDKWGAVKVRLNINRMNYRVDPGIYALGNPGPDSPVFLSANYKLSFDLLRSRLKELDAWILVLDTKGINVWCAAGKGTFGTKELVGRIELSKLKKIVTHRELIAPQLGATGVCANRVKELTGFRVIFGPVRAPDIPAFLKAGMQATREMRRIRFTFFDRIVLVPVEAVNSSRYYIYALLFFILLSGLDSSGYSLNGALDKGMYSAANLSIAYLAGVAIGPAFLPWLPGRSFSLKGVFAGLIFFIILFIYGYTGESLIETLAWLLLIPAISSFLLLSFTGSSTYASPSGVKKEMKIALPLQLTAASCGLLLWVGGRFF